MDDSKISALEGESERYTNFAEWGAKSLIIGLAVELVYVVISERPWCERLILGISNALVTGGVAAEVYFARRARSADDALRLEAQKQIAEANARAEEARERTAEIEHITSFRRVSHTQLEKIRGALSELTGRIDLLIEYQSGDTEAFVYARDITTIFLGIAAVRSIPNSYPGMPTFGLFVAASSSVDIEVVAKAFTDADIDFSRMHIDLSTHLPRGAPAPNLYVFVAPKPPPPLISPVVRPKP